MYKVNKKDKSDEWRGIIKITFANETFVHEIILNYTNLSKIANTLLEEKFGYNEFRPLQEDIIDYAMAGNDSLVIMP
jgi:superfamily II DNA helicase RecQ